MCLAKIFKLIELSDSYEDTGVVYYYNKKKNMCKDFGLTSRLISYTAEGKRQQHKGYRLEVLKVDDISEYKLEDVEYIDDEIEVDVPIKKYKPRAFNNNNNTRLAVLSGDKHFCYEDKDAIDILLQVCEDYKDSIDEFIDGGDGINNDALSKFVSTEEESFTLYDEMIAFEKHLEDVKSIIPNAKFVIVEDNHYHLRLKKFIAENPAMKNLLRGIDFPFDEQVPHGSPYLPFGQSRLGVIHGLATSDNFTKAHSQLFNIDLVNFHTHGSQHYTCKNGSKALNKQAQKMWGAPSMCKQMDYMNGRPSRSNTGFVMLWYDLENDLYDLQYVFVENKKAIKLIDKILKDLDKNGINTDILITDIKELRTYALEAKIPLVVKVLRLTYEHIEANDSFLIPILDDEPIEEGDFNNAESSPVESLKYLISLIRNLNNKSNIADLKEYRDLLNSF